MDDHKPELYELPCERSIEKIEQELEVRSMLTDVPSRKHSFQNLGRHTQDEEAWDESSSTRSKKSRTEDATNGRSDEHSLWRRQEHLSTTSSNSTTTTGGEGGEGGEGGGSSSLTKLETESSLIPGLADDEAHLCLARVPRWCYGQSCLVSNKFHSLLKSGDLYRTRRRLGIREQWVYVLISGQSVWRAFCLVDGGTIKWRPLPPSRADPCFVISDKESLTAGTQLLVVGREIGGHCIWGYDLVSDAWFRAPQMITQRYLYASASCDEHAFVAGGIDSGQSELSSAERYDSCTGRWESLPAMTRKRKMCSGFYMDGKFYVIGGVRTDESGKQMGLTCGEEYSPETRTWRQIPNMCPGRSDINSTNAPPLVAVVDNELFSLNTSSRQLMKYCKRSNSWKDIGDVPVKPDSSSGWGVAFKAVNGQLLLIGGAVYAWKPSEGPVNWRFVAEPGSFVFNCAVMSA